MRILRNTGIVIGVILSATQLFTWGASFFSPKVVARLEFGEFGLPPQLEDLYAKLAAKLQDDTFVHRVLADESFKSAASVNHLPDDVREILVRRVLLLLPNELAIFGGIPYDFRRIESYCAGSVTNSSSAQVTSVQLYLSGAMFARIKRDDNSITSQSIPNLVTIGDLRPGETVQLSIWSGAGFRYLDSRDVRLTHSAGVGRVTIPRPVTGVPAFLDKYGFFIYFILLVICGGLLFQWLMVRFVEPKLNRRAPS